MSLQLSAKDKISSLKVTNVSDEPVVLQMELKDWQQENGEDINTLTRDIIISPPIAKIGPQERQIFRLTVRKKHSSDEEKAYRVFLNEVPQPTTMQKSSIQTLLSISLPLFIKPNQLVSSNPIWSISRGEKNIIQVSLENKGNEHLKITKIRLQEGNKTKPLVEKEALDYILPLKKKGWNLALPTSFKGKEVLVCIETSQGELSEKLQLPSF
ncbi:MAG: fimbria/pilus periplasmic chaperone [Alphaproteobacteria bacterium]|nr:fimbria/pilus periplasmic chaperone [Alphaproteobacteria bacterium]